MKNLKGFSLIELMVVVAIIGIMATVAMPAYQDHVSKSRRAEGIGKLLEIMQAQETFFSENYIFAADLISGLGYTADSLKSENEYYTISAAACGGLTAAECINLTATPVTPRDGVLTLDSAGVKTGPWPN